MQSGLRARKLQHYAAMGRSTHIVTDFHNSIFTSIDYWIINKYEIKYPEYFWISSRVNTWLGHNLSDAQIS